MEGIYKVPKWAQEMVDIVHAAHEKLELLSPTIKNAVKDMRLIFQNTTMAQEQFSIYCSVEDHPEMQSLVENEALNEVFQSSTSGQDTLDISSDASDKEKVGAKVYREMLSHFNKLIDISPDYPLACKLRKMRLDFIESHEPKQRQLRLSSMFMQSTTNSP